MDRKERKWPGWAPSQKMDPNSPARAGEGIPVMPGLPVAVRHNIVCIETSDCPGVFEISCSCGEQTWTPWGPDHAEEIARVHLWAVGAPTMRVVR